MCTEDGRYVLVYNGEVYNHDALRNELREAGHRFGTRSDTEVVLHALVEWGAGALDRFDGMFALALWDRTTGTLLLARDHFGIKPLHLARVRSTGGEGWLFASEIRPILATGLVPATPDERSVYRYLRFRVHDDDRATFFTGIERVLPGEVVTIGPDGMDRRPFTSLREDLLAAARRASRGDRHEPATSLRFRDALTRAVRMRLSSDVPVGTSLSGGLDSSAVAALVDELLPEPSARAVGVRQRTFSAVFPGHRNDERRWVEDALDGRRDRVERHLVAPVTEDLVADLADFVRSQEEPVVSSGPYAQYRVMREASRHVTVMLDGQGADELLAGYVPQTVVHLRDLLRRHPVRALREALAERDVLRGLVANRARRLLPTAHDASVAPLLASAFVDEHRDERYAPAGTTLRERLVHDLFVGSLPALLRYEDRNTMRFSLEGRVPFLAVDLVRFVFDQPDASVLGDGWNKRMLREAVRDLLPESITLRRNKIGFTTPQDDWFRESPGLLRDVFGSDSFRARPWFDADAVAAAFEQWLAGGGPHDSMVFWRILNVELWMREVCYPPAPGSAPGPVDVGAPTGPEVRLRP
jgi:asparagine synthase (glutamine-hydrolysing)